MHVYHPIEMCYVINCDICMYLGKQCQGASNLKKVKFLQITKLFCLFSIYENIIIRAKRNVFDNVMRSYFANAKYKYGEGYFNLDVVGDKG